MQGSYEHIAEGDETHMSQTAAAPTRQFAARRDETVRVGQIVRRTYLKPSSFVPVTCVVFAYVYSVLGGRIFPMLLSRLLVLRGLNPLSLNLTALQVLFVLLWGRFIHHFFCK